MSTELQQDRIMELLVFWESHPDTEKSEGAFTHSLSHRETALGLGWPEWMVTSIIRLIRDSYDTLGIALNIKRGRNRKTIVVHDGSLLGRGQIFEVNAITSSATNASLSGFARFVAQRVVDYGHIEGDRRGTEAREMSQRLRQDVNILNGIASYLDLSDPLQQELFDYIERVLQAA